MSDDTPPELTALIDREAASTGPTPDARRDLRAKLGATLGITAASAAVGTATAHAAATSAAAGATTTVASGITAGIITKITVLALVVGGISGGGYMVARSRPTSAPTVAAPAPVAAPRPRVAVAPTAPSDERVDEPSLAPPPPPPASAPVVAVEPAMERVEKREPPAPRTEEPAPVAVSPPTDASAPVAVSPPPDASAPVEPPSREPESQSAMLSRAWTLIDHGNAEEALALADADAVAHRDGALSEERDAVRVRALLALDRRAEARTAARAFQATYPSSIHSALIESALNK